MTITDAEIQALKPKNRPYKISIGKGAYLQVWPNGTKYWLKYSLNGKESVYSLGVFPKISADAAQAERESVKALIRQGINPTVARREARLTARPEARTEVIPREPIFRLGLSVKGELTIITETHAITFTSRHTRALADFLSSKMQKDKESA